KRFGFFQKLWKQTVFKRMILSLRDQIEHAGFKHISPGINVSATGFFGLWLFQKAKDASVVGCFHDAVHARIFDRSEYDRGDRFAFSVLPDDGFQIKIRQNVSVENHRWLAN